MKQFNMEDNPSSNQYGGMTHYVDLPTCGAFYPQAHPLHNIPQVEIKMMTTREEDILTNQSYVENGIAVDKLLESIMLIKVDPKDIHETDKMAMLLAARIEAYGPEYEVASVCPFCSKTQEEIINLSAVLADVIDSEYEKTEAGTTIFELPKSNKVVEFRNLLPKDLESINKSVEKMKKLNINTNFNIEFFKRIIVSIDGVEDKEEISKFVDGIRIMDSRALSKAYNGSMPSINTERKTVCGSCGKESQGGLPIQANFFFPEL
tara:strand:+ start:3681 stop:4469 length:789 start_codon:yes stop_codon:yes gene_type:complete